MRGRPTRFENIWEDNLSLKDAIVHFEDHIPKMKAIIQMDSVKPELSTNEIISYSIYDAKRNIIFAKAIYYGVLLSLFRRITFAKLNINLRPSENLLCDIALPVTYMNFATKVEYQRLYRVINKNVKQEEDEIKRKSLEKKYQAEMKSQEKQFRSKFFTDSQYWH